MNYWKVLLIEQRNRGRSGFTIPFIIGSQNYLPEEHPRLSVESLLFEILSNDSFNTCIRYCSDTNELILEIKKENTPVIYPNYNGLSQTNFSVSIANKDLGTTSEEIIETLTEKFQSYIDKGHYSVKNREYGRDSVWGDFSESEIDFIKKCISKI